MSLKTTSVVGRGPFKFRTGHGVLLLDWDVAEAIVRGGKVCELPDKSLYNAPEGSDVLGGAGAFSASTGWTLLSGARDGSGSISSGVLTLDGTPANNNAPQITTPSTQTTPEDTSKSITVSVADTDGDVLMVTLDCSHGTITLASTSGLLGVTGNGTASVSFSGSAANCTTAMTGMTYAPTANYNGADAIDITVDDGYVDDPVEDSVDITVSSVDDLPVLTVPGAQTATEDTNKSITGTSVADVDSASTTVLMSALHGVMTLASSTGLTFTTGDGTSDATMEFSGALTNVNNALATITYRANTNYNGSDTLTIRATSSPSVYDEDTISITVNAVNDAPTLNVPGSQTTDEETSVDITGSSVGDVDAPASLDLTLTVSHGTITLASLTGLTFISGDGASDASMRFTGSIANINNAIATLTYLPAASYVGSDSLDYSLTDGVASAVTNSVAITVTSVNATPVVTVPGAQSTNEDTSKTFSSGGSNQISVADSDDTNLTVRIRVDHGTLTLSGTTGLTFDSGSNGGADFTFHGTITNINTALNGLSYAPTANYNGSDTLTVRATDGLSEFDEETVAITVNSVNDAPINTVPGTQTFNEDTTRTFSSGNGNQVSVSDVDGGNLTVTLTVTHGTLALAGTSGLTGSTSSGSTVGPFTGTAANINAAMNGMVFTPTAQYHGSASLQISTDDANSANDTDSVTLTISSVDDGSPTITSNGGGSTASVDINAPDTYVTTVTGTDPDGGTLTRSISGSADAALFEFSGNDLQFQDPSTDGTYEVIVRVTSSDDSQYDEQTITVNVTTPIPELVLNMQMTDANDSSGEGNNGSLVGDAVLTGGKLEIVSVGGGIDIPDSASWSLFSTTGEGTVFARVKTTGNGTVFVIPVGASWAPPYALVVLRVGASKAEGAWGDAGQTILGTTDVDTDVEFALCLTWDGTTQRLYVNGVEENNSTPTITLGDPTVGPQIGRNLYAHENLPVGAQVDDVRVWTRCLSPSEVAALT